MGNRTEVTKTRPAGDAGGNAVFDYSPTSYEINNLNQYQRRTVPGIYDVLAISNATGVTVDGDAMAKQNDIFFRGHPLNNATSAVFETLTIAPASGTSVDQDAFLPATNEDFTYDLDGNLTRDGRWDYTYDAENRLIKIETRSSVVGTAPLMPATKKQKIEFAYDYQGRRVNKIVYEWTTTWVETDDIKYLYDGWNLLYELDANSSLSNLNAYIWGLDLSGTLQGAGGVGGLLYSYDYATSTALMPCYDANGNVWGLVDPSSDIVATYDGAEQGGDGQTGWIARRAGGETDWQYDAFGNTLRETGAYAADNPFRFSTKYTDNETSLVYYGHRYYSPSLGRFINRDPIEEQGGINLYTFVGNNSINAWDYLGMCGGFDAFEWYAGEDPTQGIARGDPFCFHEDRIPGVTSYDYDGGELSVGSSFIPDNVGEAEAEDDKKKADSDDAGREAKRKECEGLSGIISHFQNEAQRALNSYNGQLAYSQMLQASFSGDNDEWIDNGLDFLGDLGGDIGFGMAGGLMGSQFAGLANAFYSASQSANEENALSTAGHISIGVYVCVNEIRPPNFRGSGYGIMAGRVLPISSVLGIGIKVYEHFGSTIYNEIQQAEIMGQNNQITSQLMDNYIKQDGLVKQFQQQWKEKGCDEL